MPLTAEAEKKIKSALDSCTDPANGTGIPGLVFCAIDRSGKYLTKQASGNIGLDSKTPMDLDTVFWIASCTKAITGVACMQLVEQGKINLDSSAQLYSICPELRDIEVLTDDLQLVDKKRDITLRMLLSHTAGFGYSLFREKLRDYNELSGHPDDYLKQPLVNQPGEVWEYGMNIDWAGILVQRLTNMTLEDYFRKYIFEPLGVENASFFPNDFMRQHMVKGVQRDANGAAHDAKEHPYNTFITVDESERSKFFQAGGAGLFMQPTQYCLILAALLNDGTSPSTGKKILEKNTVDEMFTNQIPEFPDFGRRGIPSAKPHLVNPAPDLYPQEGNPPQGWGLTFLITIAPGATGRSAGTGHWSGVVNLYYWVDRTKGVAGMIAAQILPAGDMPVIGAWLECEKAVYDGLDT